MKTVEYKYSPKDAVYWILPHNIPVEGKCPSCLGDGNFIRRADGASVNCHACKGSGKVNIGYDSSYEVFKGYVDEVKIFVDEWGTIISYDVSEIARGQGRMKSSEEKELYIDLRSATDACEKLNKQGAMGSRGTYGTT